MDRGVLEVHAPDGRVWWVKRAWMPRYRSVRDRVGDYVDSHERHWYQAPLRWFAGGNRHLDLVIRDPRVVALLDLDGPPPPVGSPLVPDFGGSFVWPGDLGGHHDLGAPDVPSTADVHPAGALLDIGGGGDLGDGPDAAALAGALGNLEMGGGGALAGDIAGAVSAGGDFASGAFGGGGGLGAGDTVGGGGVEAGDVLGGDWDDLTVVVLAVVAVVAAIALAWFVLLPLLLVVVDGVVVIVALVCAGLVRLLFRRPWDVVAVRDLRVGGQLVRRWEVRGFHRAGQARDDVARALQTGTDCDLAVARVVVRSPRDDDPGGLARSVVVLQGIAADLARAQLSERRIDTRAPRLRPPGRRRGKGR